MRFAFNPFIVGFLVAASFVLSFINLDLAIYAAFFLMPFEWTGAFALNPETHLGAIIRLIQILFAGTIPAFLLMALFKKKKIVADRSLIFFLLFLISAAISAVMINYFRVYQVYPYLIYVFFVYVFISQAVKEKHLPGIEKALTITTILSVAYGIFQFVGDLAGLSNKITGLLPWYTKAWTEITRIQSVSREPLYYGNFLLIPLTLFYAKYLGAMPQKSKRYFILMLIVAGALFLTLSRGAMAGAVVSMLLVSALKFKDFKKKLPVLGITFVIFLLVSFSGLIIAAKTQGKPALSWVKGYYTQVVEVVFTGKHGSISSREKAFDIGAEAVFANPVFGLGFGGIGPWYKDYPEKAPEEWFVALSMPIQLLAEAGILGTSLFIAFVFFVIRRAWKAFSKSQGEINLYLAAMLAAYAGIWVQYLSLSYFFLTHIWMVLGLITALSAMTDKPKEIF